MQHNLDMQPSARLGGSASPGEATVGRAPHRRRQVRLRDPVPRRGRARQARGPRREERDGGLRDRRWSSRSGIETIDRRPDVGAPAADARDHDGDRRAGDHRRRRLRRPPVAARTRTPSTRHQQRRSWSTTATRGSCTARSRRSAPTSSTASAPSWRSRRSSASSSTARTAPAWRSTARSPWRRCSDRKEPGWRWGGGSDARPGEAPARRLRGDGGRRAVERVRLARLRHAPESDAGAGRRSALRSLVVERLRQRPLAGRAAGGWIVGRLVPDVGDGDDRARPGEDQPPPANLRGRC